MKPVSLSNTLRPLLRHVLALSPDPLAPTLASEISHNASCRRDHPAITAAPTSPWPARFGEPLDQLAIVLSSP